LRAGLRSFNDPMTDVAARE